MSSLAYGLITGTRVVTEKEIIAALVDIVDVYGKDYVYQTKSGAQYEDDACMYFSPNGKTGVAKTRPRCIVGQVMYVLDMVADIPALQIRSWNQKGVKYLWDATGKANVDGLPNLTHKAYDALVAAQTEQDPKWMGGNETMGTWGDALTAARKAIK